MTTVWRRLERRDPSSSHSSAIPVFTDSAIKLAQDALLGVLSVIPLVRVAYCIDANEPD
jgi:hypothetical protein